MRLTDHGRPEYPGYASDLPDMDCDTVLCDWCATKVSEPNAVTDKRGVVYCSDVCMDEDAADRAASQADSAEDA